MGASPSLETTQRASFWLSPLPFPFPSGSCRVSFTLLIYFFAAVISGTTVTYHAGVATWTASASSYTVSIGATMPNTNYEVSVLLASTPNWSSSKAPIFEITAKTTTTFTIASFTDDAAALDAPATAPTIDWIVIANN